jgi:hypothetical protein
VHRYRLHRADDGDGYASWNCTSMPISQPSIRRVLSVSDVEDAT